jgi:hypothetical protein
VNFEPQNNETYLKKEYWEERYSKESSYEWLLGYKDIKKYINDRIPDKNTKILIIGCGNSNLGPDM